MARIGRKTKAPISLPASTDVGTADKIAEEMRKHGLSVQAEEVEETTGDTTGVQFAAQPIEEDAETGMPDPATITYSGSVVLSDDIGDVDVSGNSVKASPGVYAIPVRKQDAEQYTAVNFHLVRRGDRLPNGQPLIANEGIYEADANGLLIRGDCYIAAISMEAHKRYLERLAKRNRELVAAGDGETLIIQRGPITARA